jgi:hypothetical protein
MRSRGWTSFFLTLLVSVPLATSALAAEQGLSPPVPEILHESKSEIPADSEVLRPVTGSGEDNFSEVPSGYPSISACCCTPSAYEKWTVRTGIVFLRRDSQDSQAIINGATPITVDGLAFHDYQAGALLTVIRHSILNSAWDLDVTYFGVNDFQNSASSPGVSALFTTPTIFIGGGLTVTTDYSSSFHSTEVNFRRNLNSRFTALTGFRWVEVGDLLSTDIGGLASHSINVNNHLYGLQVGGQARVFSRNRFSVDAVGKVGVYGNRADQSTSTAGIGGALPALSARDSNVAFLGELGLTCNYAINHRWSVRSGYQAIWLDGIALAPDQLGSADLVTGVATLNTSGHPIYHGLTLAADFRW